MREIRFRAWDKVLGTCDVVGVDFETNTVTVMDKKTGRFYTLNIENANLMQYTGLKDKNGKEVYEGDIIRGQYNKIGIIQHYALTPHSGFGIQYWDEDNLEWSDEMRSEYGVIGNIYENPKLLEPNQDQTVIKNLPREK